MSMSSSPILRSVTVAASSALLAAALAVPAMAVDAPPSPVLVGDSANGATISDLHMNGDATTVAVVPRGASVMVEATTGITSDDCPGCITHVPAGFEGSSFGGCLFAGGLWSTPQSRSFTLTAPAAFGVYDVVAAYHWNYGCADWWDGTGTTFAKVVVAEPPEAKRDCKKGGWRDLSSLGGQPFRNQGRCVSYFNRVIRTK